MQQIVIEGGRPLKGKVQVAGAKNAALPLMAASLLTDQTIELSNVPALADVKTLTKVLIHLGCEVELNQSNLKLNTPKLSTPEAPYDLVRTMRASILVLGPLLARFGQAKVSLPGGCAIGARPVDRHLKALEAMGATIELENGYINAKASRLRGARIVFDEVTVTGTENILMAACLADGETIIENAACEPEVIDLADMLKKMGAKIEGAGSPKIVVQGKTNLKAAQHAILGDRIEAGTYLIAAAITAGEVEVCGVPSHYLDALVDKLHQTGVQIRATENSVWLKAGATIEPVSIQTQPHPGFATDFQAQFMALMGLAKGNSVITENIFENRFMHVAELKRLGADIQINGRVAIVNGVHHYVGAPVMATDLRASASLVLAGLAAKGKTSVSRIYHLDRGYAGLEEKLKLLGANIERIKVND